MCLGIQVTAMSNGIIAVKRIKELREEMRLAGIDTYLVFTDDYHQSGASCKYFKSVQFLTGFTGSAATVVITSDWAGLWTDGRYFVQAAEQLSGSGVLLMKIGEPDVMSVMDFVRERGGTCVGFDGRCVNAVFGKQLREIQEKKGGSIAGQWDLVGNIWENRPELPQSNVWILGEEYSGLSTALKITFLREKMAEWNTDTHLITSLEDIAWILNLRGGEEFFSRVFLSYLILTDKKACLFMKSEDVNGAVQNYLQNNGVELYEYEQFYKEAEKLQNRHILLESDGVNDTLYRLVSRENHIVDTILPSSLKKAVKNPTEIQNIKNVHIKDGVAVTRYIYFLKHAFDDRGDLTKWAKACLLEAQTGTVNENKEVKLTELTASAYLELLRREQEGNLGFSFRNISAYGAHAAMGHYGATEESDIEILPRGLYLIDSGGQYYEGTTDVTRTVAMGEITEEQRHHYTMTVQSMLRLADAKFKYGCSGMALDYIARELFWREGLDYNHGTGHGVSYLLHVHERPNGFRYMRVPDRMDDGILEEGHITSDEPGIYMEGSHGVRTENLLLCVKSQENQYGTFMQFEHLTCVPLDLDALNIAQMTSNDKKLLNNYHQMVYFKLSPYLSEEENKWLKKVTRDI